jgi:hypothetical protein
MAGPLDRTWFNALVDDDGSGTTGTIWEKSQVDGLMDAVDAALATVPTAPVPPSSVTPAGSDKQVQFNDAGVLRGDAGLTYDKASRQLAAGAIVFPTTAVPSANLTTLDDYREGAWTPAITGSGGGSGQTYTSQIGSYQKIGRWVTANFYVIVNGAGTLSGDVRITGLPFPHDNAGLSPCAVLWHNSGVQYINVLGELDPGTAYLRLMALGTAAFSIAIAPMPASAVIGGFTVAGSIRYPTLN